MTQNKPPRFASAPAPDRLVLLDELRGLNLISMILYHFVWDLVYIAGLSIPWYYGHGAYLWQQGICRIFIFLSGFCWLFGRKHFKRGLTVWLSGALVTLVTLVFVPEDRVLFGVLTLLGTCMLLMIPLHGLFGRVKSLWGNGMLFLLSLFVFQVLYSVRADIPAPPEGSPWEWPLIYLGFPTKSFYSTDYFPLLPWFFLFAAGYFFHRLAELLHFRESALLRRSFCPFLAAVGRRSLLIYLLHQPVLYGATMLFLLIKNLNPQ
ncbi:MAG: DUF1624 domain-containing protein [Muribaculum sp.]|nr:DUF1624 domain-containing protein [Muribaculum sp.]